jgi:hypothetical protein
MKLGLMAGGWPPRAGEATRWPARLLASAQETSATAFALPKL